MTIVTEFNEMIRLKNARRQPNLSFLSFSVTEMLAEIRFRLFSDVTQDVQVAFVADGPLACVAHDEIRATIYVHQLLNHHETPQVVLTTIIKHELLHLRISPAMVGEKEVQHPDEFWEAEVAIAPERQLAWLWIYANFGQCVKRRPKLERIDVLPGWRQAWCRRKNSIAECQELIAPQVNGDGNIW